MADCTCLWTGNYSVQTIHIVDVACPSWPHPRRRSGQTPTVTSQDDPDEQKDDQHG